jgi:hypothetical protein
MKTAIFIISFGIAIVVYLFLIRPPLMAYYKNQIKVFRGKNSVDILIKQITNRVIFELTPVAILTAVLFLGMSRLFTTQPSPPEPQPQQQPQLPPTPTTNLADDLTAANEHCVAMATKQAMASLPPETPEDQKAMMSGMLTDACGCFTTRLNEMGDDGQKFLRVLAVEPEEDAMVTDQAESKKRTVAVLVKEFGMSEEEAGALYDRVNPKVTEAAMACAQEAKSKMQAPQ